MGWGDEVDQRSSSARKGISASVSGCKPNAHVQHQEQHTARCQPPEHNYVKCNVKIESGTRLSHSHSHIES